MLRGTRIIEELEAEYFATAIQSMEEAAFTYGFKRIIVPSIWESSTFINKVGPENKSMMWTFKDQGDRDVCLIPEVTGLIQEMWAEKWGKRARKVFYTQRCYRYERPQKGRYREFTQFGVEYLFDKDWNDDKRQKARKEVLKLLAYWFKESNYWLRFEYEFNPSVKRGLSYYIEDGFEYSVPSLGAQKQVAGGGIYDCGVGFAIGVDRIVLAAEDQWAKK